MFCIKCGTKIGEDDQFCAACGAPQPKTDTQPSATNPVEIKPQSISAPNPTLGGTSATTLVPQKTKQKRGKFWVGLACGILIMALVAGLLQIGGKLSFTGMHSAQGAPVSGVPASNAPTSEAPPTPSDSLQVNSAVQAAQFEGNGYDSSEEAVEAYIKALRNEDIDAMLSTFAIDTYVENFDLSALISRMGVYSPNSYQPLPAGAGTMPTGLNKLHRISDLYRQIYFQYMTLTQPDPRVLEMQPIPFSSSESDAEIQAFVQELAPKNAPEILKSLKIQEFLNPQALSKLYQKDDIRNNVRSNALAYIGADELKDQIVRVEVNGEAYLFCMDTVCYNGKWFNKCLGGTNSVVLGISTTNSGVIREADLR